MCDFFSFFASNMCSSGEISLKPSGSVGVFCHLAVGQCPKLWNIDVKVDRCSGVPQSQVWLEPDHSTLDKTLTILRPINCMKYKDFFLSIPQPHSSGQIHQYFCNHKHDINTFASFYTFSNMISCHIKPTITEYESTVYRSKYIHNLQLWPYFHKSVVTVHTVVFNSRA